MEVVAEEIGGELEHHEVVCENARLPFLENLDDANSVDECALTRTFTVDGDAFDHQSQISIHDSEHRAEVPRDALQGCDGPRIMFNRREGALDSYRSHVVSSRLSVPPSRFQYAALGSEGRERYKTARCPLHPDYFPERPRSASSEATIALATSGE